MKFLTHTFHHKSNTLHSLISYHSLKKSPNYMVIGLLCILWIQEKDFYFHPLKLELLSIFIFFVECYLFWTEIKLSGPQQHHYISHTHFNLVLTRLFQQNIFKHSPVLVLLLVGIFLVTKVLKFDDIISTTNLSLHSRILCLWCRCLPKKKVSVCELWRYIYMCVCALIMLYNCPWLICHYSCHFYLASIANDFGRGSCWSKMI